MPKVTVLLLTYKSNPKYLKESVESALSQAFGDFEMLVIDDGPGEINKLVLKEYLGKDKRIKIIQNKPRIGRLKSRNLGLNKARGEYIAVLDSDDFWCDKQKLEKQVKFLDQNQDYGAVGTAMFLIDENGKKIGQVQYPAADKEIRKYMLSSFQLAHPSVLFRRSVAEKIRGYSENRFLKFAEDYDFFLRVGQKYKLANLPDYCLKYRIHPGSGSTKNESKQRLTGVLVTLKYLGKYPGGASATLKKLATLFLPRSLMDKLIAKCKIAKEIYSRTTGISKKL